MRQVVSIGASSELASALSTVAGATPLEDGPLVRLLRDAHTAAAIAVAKQSRTSEPQRVLVDKRAWDVLVAQSSDTEWLTRAESDLEVLEVDDRGETPSDDAQAAFRRAAREDAARLGDKGGVVLHEERTGTSKRFAIPQLPPVAGVALLVASSAVAVAALAALSSKYGGAMGRSGMTQLGLAAVAIIVDAIIVARLLCYKQPGKPKELPAKATAAVPLPREREGTTTEPASAESPSSPVEPPSAPVEPPARVLGEVEEEEEETEDGWTLVKRVPATD
jgi:hypothetical protein